MRANERYFIRHARDNLYILEVVHYYKYWGVDCPEPYSVISGTGTVTWGSWQFCIDALKKMGW